MLFTFPLRYWFTIGLSGVFSLTRWCWWIPTGRLRPRGTQDTAIRKIFMLTGLSPSLVQLSRSFCFKFSFMLQSYNPLTTVVARVWANPLSLATTYGITELFSLPPGTEMFQFSGFAFPLLGISRLHRDGLPHSETCGSLPICGSPQLIAAYHVLHRL